jgi:multidrug resistance efflux pump
LPTVQNNRDWLRQAQRIPVIVEIDRSESSKLHRVPVGGQADVLVYTGRHPILNALGTLYIHVMSWVSYLY